MADDPLGCARWQDVISASVDGEDCGVEERLLDAHLAHCAGCRDFRDFAERSRRAVRVEPVVATPDLAPRIVKLNAIADRASRWSVARAVLAVVAIEIIVFSMPMLILGSEGSESAHEARHLGAFTAAYGVGLLVVVVRPARARAVLPVTMVLAGALSITALIDLLSGDVPLIGEAQHLPELLSVVLVWYVAVPSPRRGRPVGSTRLGPLSRTVRMGELRAVDRHGETDPGAGGRRISGPGG